MPFALARSLILLQSACVRVSCGCCDCAVLGRCWCVLGFCSLDIHSLAALEGIAVALFRTFAIARLIWAGFAFCFYSADIDSLAALAGVAAAKQFLFILGLRGLGFGV